LNVSEEDEPMISLRGKDLRVLVISADDFEDSELTEPTRALQQAGVEVDIASLQAGTIRGKKGVEVEAPLAVDDVDADAYDLLFLPGGKAPARLRDSARVQDLVRSFLAAAKPIAAICHGPQILISADVVKGRTMTAYASVGEELQAAGAEYVDQMVVTDANFVTARQPSDLPAFNEQILETLRQRAETA
jgi:protease I